MAPFYPPLRDDIHPMTLPPDDDEEYDVYGEGFNRKKHLKFKNEVITSHSTSTSASTSASTSTPTSTQNKKTRTYFLVETD